MADPADTSEGGLKSPEGDGSSIVVGSPEGSSPEVVISEVENSDGASEKSSDPAPAQSAEVENPAAAAPAPQPATPPPPKKMSNIVVGLCLAVLGVVIVGVITMFTPTPTKDQDVPYLLDPLEKQLDKHVRYKRPSSLEAKDWRNDLAIEQRIWTNEVSKIILGRPDAKPIEFKRDYLLYLGDSYYKDEPHFAEAKAAYLTANASPAIAHTGSYNYGSDELWRRIGYCDTRLGFYDEAEAWYKKALTLNEEAAKTNKDISLKTTRWRILDNMGENYARKGETKKAEGMVGLRLREMSQPMIEQCVEMPVVYNMALAKEKEGNLARAEELYKICIAICDREDKAKGIVVVPQSINDNNRTLARVLMSYSRMLRLAHRDDEAIVIMLRALCIYDNPPGQQ